MANEMIKLEVATAKFTTKIAGEEITVDFARMHPSWLEAHLQKAAQRFLNDKYSGLEAKDKLEAIKAELVEIHKGEPMPEKSRRASGVSTVDPVVALTMKNAKADLVAMFRAAGIGTKVAEFAEHEKSGKYFREVGNVMAWDDKAVLDWVVAQKAAGKRDYVADAEAVLNGATEDALDF